MTTPNVGFSLSYLIPLPVKTQLKFRMPSEVQMRGGSRGLIAAVGSGTPLRWLWLEPVQSGQIRCRAWSVLASGLDWIGDETVSSDSVPALLQGWARVISA